MQKIMFDDRFHLTEAVLNGDKTMTRRPAKKVLVKNTGQELVWNGEFKQPKYKVGDIVAVAQSYHSLNRSGYLAPEWLDHSCEDSAGYENKMFVKAELMPHHIQITDVRLERICCIDDNDCLKEGVFKSNIGYYVKGLKARNRTKEDCVEIDGTVYKQFKDPIQAFRALIDKECGKGFWNDSEFVYAYTFKLVD